MDQDISAEGGHPGTTRARRTLTPRQTQILKIIERTIAKTGVSPSRSEIARAAKISNPPAIEPVLVALEKRGLIELPHRAQRSIRIIDRAAAPIIKCLSCVDAAEPLVSDIRTVDQAPGTLAARAGNVDYFVHMGDETLELIGVRPGDLVGMRSAVTMGQGKIMAARDEHGVLRWYRTTVDRDMAVKCERLDSQGDNRLPYATQLRADGTVAGVVRVRARHCTSATTSSNDSERPTAKQRAVLEIMRRHVRVRGIPPSLKEIATILGNGATSGSVRAHMKGLERKGLAARATTKQRTWWPTETGTVPIVDVDSWLASIQKGQKCRMVKERAPDTLAESFRPRPNLFLAPNQDIAQRLDLETSDLVAVTTTTEAGEGEIVLVHAVARDETACGELHWRDNALAELRPITCNDSPTPIVADMGTGEWTIMGVVTGTVTFNPGTLGE